jgi:dipeptidyl aminopeptidase/acylaminoacyl peptidase
MGRELRLLAAAAALLLASACLSPLNAQTPASPQPTPFTLQQILSAPYATNLTAAPTGNLFAWVEHTEGRNNLFLGGPGHAARQLTRFTADDGRDITALTWSPRSDAIAFAFGTETGADNQPANPAHLQQDMATEIRVVSLTAGPQDHLTVHGHAPLFSRDGDTLFWIDAGKIWARTLNGDPTPAAPDKPLIVDRGSASQLTLSPNGQTLAYISHRTEDGQPSHSFVALYNLRSHTLTFPAPSTGNDSAPIFSPDGHQLAWLRAPFTIISEFAPNRSSPNPWSIQLFDLTTDQTRTVFTPEPNQRGSVLPHLADSEPRLFFSNHAISFYSEADGWVHLYEIDPAGSAGIREVQWLTPGHSETEDATFSQDHQTLLYSSNQVANDPLDADRRHLWHLDLTQPDALPVELTHGTGIETHPVLAADGTLAALVSDAHTPMHPALIEKDGTILPLHPTALPPDYPTAALVTPQQVLFASKPQPTIPPIIGPAALNQPPLTLHGQIFLPSTPSQKKRPAIVFVHGGPNRQMLLGYPAMDYYSNAYAMNQYLTSRGFIVLSVNYRCGIGYGIDFRQCIHEGADGGEEYNDVLAAAKYLRGRPDVDPARIGIWGGSYGGYLTALALARNSNLFAAGVDFHGVHDWNFEENATGWKPATYALRDAVAARALSSSPLADISHWTSPILLIHGDNDPDVAYAQTPTLADALRSRNASLPPSAQVTVQEIIFPDEVHGFLLHKDWLAAYTAAAAFFERTLKP